ncbi:hypothetical protein LIER_43355 [Lithospermum erythrorhizon]|uniref:F-box domain-containing protein n=1 Tax=Lithospermum erythrorhizon TaxID=34254 RepID=A0AAV3PWP1_LITER
MDSSEKSYWWKLPVDIQAYILRRLEGKTLLSLKLVSWDWYDVISYLCITTFAPPSPESAFCGFIYKRQGEGTRPISTGRLRYAELIRKATFRVSYKGITDRLRQFQQSEEIQDCCNGILLVVSHDNDGGVSYSVFNPTTGERIQVPRPLPHDYHTHNDRTQCCFASLAFDPAKSLNYKIIYTLGGNITNPLKVEMFSSETGKWSRYVVDIDSKLDGVEWVHRSAYLDGRLYRLLNTNYLLCIKEGKSSEPLRVLAIGLPNGGSDNMYIDGDNCHGSIGISMRRLHYSTRCRNGSTLLVYMLKDDGGWLLKYTIPIDDLLADQSYVFFSALKRTVNKYRNEAWFNFYDFHPNRDCFFLITPQHMLYYSPKEKFCLFTLPNYTPKFFPKGFLCKS